MNTMTHKGYAARIEYSEEDKAFIGRIAGINAIVTFHGETVAELRAAFHEAVDDYLDFCAERGKEPQRPYSGRLMFRVSPDLHQRATLAAEVSGKSLNQWGEEVLERATRD